LSETGTHNGAVLLVRHDPGLGDVVGEYLYNRGFDVHEAEDVADGLERFRSVRPFVVFLDGAVPEPEAEEILMALGKEAPDIPVVVIASNDQLPMSLGGVELDAYEIIPRPISLAAVEHAVRHAKFNARLWEATRAHLRYLERRNVQLDVRLHDLERVGQELQRENLQRVRREQDFRQERLNHEDTERRLSTIQAAFDSAGDAILITDPDGEVIYVNAAFHHTFGESRGDARAFDLGRIFVNPAVATNMKENVATLGTFSCEVEMVAGDGEAFPAMVRASTIHDERTGAGGRLFIFSDITEQEQLRKQAYHDALTGLYSRRHFMEQLTQSMSLARRHGHPLSLCLCDLDKFKQVNDTHGHIMGDEVLKVFAEYLSAEVRTEDIAGRLGGDEFCLIFPHGRAEGAAISLERIRQKFEAHVFATEDGRTFRCAATFGIADMEPVDLTPEALIELADQSLYAAKELGRNCVVANGKRIELSGIAK